MRRRAPRPSAGFAAFVLAASLLAPHRLLRAGETGPARPADTSARLTIGEPEIAPTPGRRSVLDVHLDDYSGRVAQVRVRVGNQTREPLARDAGSTVASWGVAVTPLDASPIPVIAEAVDATGKVLARAVRWIVPAGSLEERVSVRAAPAWSDLVPKTSTLHQSPVVLVHPIHATALTDDERRFGLNRRSVRVVFLVDAGFGADTAAIVTELQAAAAPGGRLLRRSDGIGILLLDRPARVLADFPDRWLARAVPLGPGPADGAPADLGAFLTGLMSGAPDDASVALVFVTNGVQFGTLWKRKTLPGTRETDALLTADDMAQIRGLAFEREIPIFSLAVSTAARPLLTDASDHIDFAPLEGRLEAESRASAVRDGAGPDEAQEQARRGIARFDVYVRQMFELLGTLSGGTEAGRRLRLTQAGAIEPALKEVLGGLVGRFQRRDFEVLEGADPRCGDGTAQQVERVDYRSRDKVILLVTLDESGSTHNDISARQILEAVRRIIPGMRLGDDCLMLSTFSAGMPDGRFECIQSVQQAEERLGNRVRFGGFTDIYGAAVAEARRITDMEALLRLDVGAMSPGDEIRKVLVIVTDGYQTVNDTTTVEAADALRRAGVLVFEIIVPGEYAGGSLFAGTYAAGWSAAVGGSVLPRPDTLAGAEAVDRETSALLQSVYWGARESYRIHYTSTSPEKDRRRVCIGIRSRPDLFVTREGGDSYAADRPASSQLVDVARDGSLPDERRRRALAALAEVGGVYELPPLRRIVAGAGAGLRGAAALALLRLAERLRMPDDRLAELLADVAPDARLEMLQLLGQVPRPVETETLSRETAEQAALYELAGDPAAPDSTGIRLAAMIALGRLGPPSARAEAAVRRYLGASDELVALAASSLLALKR